MKGKRVCETSEKRFYNHIEAVVGLFLLHASQPLLERVSWCVYDAVYANTIQCYEIARYLLRTHDMSTILKRTDTVWPKAKRHASSIDEELGAVRDPVRTQ